MEIVNEAIGNVTQFKYLGANVTNQISFHE